MLETLSLALATPIAKIVLDKFYEGCGSKLGEKAIALATAPIEKLGTLVWEKCFKGKPGTTELLEAAAKGSEAELTQVKAYLLRALENEEFAAVVKPIAQVDDDSLMIQQNSGGTNYMTKTGPNNTNFFGGEHRHS
jgi:hypothetical protein